MNKIIFINKQAPALNATNLNLLQDNVEDAITDSENVINNKISTTNANISQMQNIILVALDNDVTLTSTDKKKLTLTQKLKEGTKLSVSNGGVRIGAGVSLVEVSGNVYFANGYDRYDNLRAFITKNNVNVAKNWSRCGGLYEDRNIIPYPIQVSEGDIINLYGGNATSGKGVIGAGSDIPNTYLIVKVIK